jgi:hypothetical protein
MNLRQPTCMVEAVPGAKLRDTGSEPRSRHSKLISARDAIQCQTAFAFVCCGSLRSTFSRAVNTVTVLWRKCFQAYEAVAFGLCDGLKVALAGTVFTLFGYASDKRLAAVTASHLFPWRRFVQSYMARGTQHFNVGGICHQLRLLQFPWVLQVMACQMLGAAASRTFSAFELQALDESVPSTPTVPSHTSTRLSTTTTDTRTSHRAVTPKALVDKFLRDYEGFFADFARSLCSGIFAPPVALSGAETRSLGLREVTA